MYDGDFVLAINKRDPNYNKLVEMHIINPAYLDGNYIKYSTNYDQSYHYKDKPIGTVVDSDLLLKIITAKRNYEEMEKSEEPEVITLEKAFSESLKGKNYQVYDESDDDWVSIKDWMVSELLSLENPKIRFVEDRTATAKDGTKFIIPCENVPDQKLIYIIDFNMPDGIRAVPVHECTEHHLTNGAVHTTYDNALSHYKAIMGLIGK